MAIEFLDEADGFTNPPKETLGKVEFLDEKKPSVQFVDETSGKSVQFLDEPTPSSGIGEQIKDIPRSALYGAADAFSGAVEGASRGIGNISRKLAESNEGNYNAMAESGQDMEGFKAKSFDVLGKFHRNMENYWTEYEGTTGLSVDKIDEIRDNMRANFAPESSGYITDIAKGVGGMATLPLDLGVGGVLSIPGQMFDEGYQQSTGTEDERLDKATAYAITASPVELAGDIMLKKFGGKATKRGMTAIAKQAMKKLGLNFISEGGTETLQDGILNKINGKRMFDENSMRTFLVSGTVGTIVSGAHIVNNEVKSSRTRGQLETMGLNEAEINTTMELIGKGKVDEANAFIADKKNLKLTDIIEASQQASSENFPLDEKQTSQLETLVGKDELTGDEQAQLADLQMTLDADDQAIIDEAIAKSEGSDAVFNDLITRLKNEDTLSTTEEQTVADEAAQTAAKLQQQEAQDGDIKRSQETRAVEQGQATQAEATSAVETDTAGAQVVRTAEEGKVDGEPVKVEKAVEQSQKAQEGAKKTETVDQRLEQIGISRAMRKVINDQHGIENTPLPEREAQADLLADAIEQEVDADIILDEVATAPRQLEGIEVASLTLKSSEVVDNIRILKAELSQTTNESERSAIELQIGVQLEYLEKIENGVSAAGTKMGRGLAALNMRLIRGTYDIASVMSKARKNKGSSLTPKDRSKLSKDLDSVNEQQDKVKDMLGEESSDILKAKNKKELLDKSKDYLSYLEGVHREIKEQKEQKPPKEKSEQQRRNDQLEALIKQQDVVIALQNILNGTTKKKAAESKKQLDPEGYIAEAKNLRKKIADEQRKVAKTEADRVAKAKRIKKINDEINTLTGEIEGVYRVIPKKKDGKQLSEKEIERNELRVTKRQQDRVIELQNILNGDEVKKVVKKAKEQDKEGYVAEAKNLAGQIRKNDEYKRYLERERIKEKTLDDKIAETTDNIEQVKRTIEKKTEGKKPSIKQQILKKLKGIEGDQDKVIELQNIFNEQIVEASDKKKITEDPEGLKAMAKNLRKMIHESDWYKEAKANPTKITKKRIAMLEEQIKRLEDQAKGMYRDIKKAKVIEDSSVELLKDRIKFMKEEMRIGDELAVVNEDLRLISEGRYSEVDEIKRRNKKAKKIEGLDKERAELRMRKDTLNQSINELSRNGASKVFMDVADFLRSMKLSLDTWIGRQGAKTLLSDPKTALSAFKDSMAGSINSSKFYELSRQIEAMPSTKHGKQHGLEIMEAGGTFELHQEAMNSKLAEKFPFVRWSNRNMVLGINSMRAKMYQKWVNRYPNESSEFYENVASFINEWSGRGTLGPLEKGAHGLSAIFTAPRWVTSNWQTIVSERKAWVKNPKTGKKELDKRLLRDISTQKAKAALGFGMVASMMIAAGWEFEEDPEEGDFMKLRKDDMVIDIMPGLSSNLRLLGVLAESVGARFGVGELEGRSSFSDVADRYLSYKYAPIIGAGRELITGETAIGDEREVEETILMSMVPIMLESIYQDYKKDGEELQDVMKAQGIQWFGFGAGIYEDRDL